MDEGLGAPMVYQHSVCGHEFTPILVCSECQQAGECETGEANRYVCVFPILSAEKISLIAIP